MNINNLLLKIKNKKPTSKWIFKIKSIIFLILFLIFIFIGIISTSILFYYLFNSDFNINLTNFPNFIKTLISSLPYIWILLSILFLFIAYFNFKNTKNGYKYLTIKNVLITLFFSIISGGFLYYFGVSEVINNSLEKNIPAYRRHNEITVINKWSNPDGGLLTGKITNIISNTNFEIIDYKNNIWNIIVDEKTNIKNRVSIEINSRIKILGEKNNENIFYAKEIRPFFGMKAINNK